MKWDAVMNQAMLKCVKKLRNKDFVFLRSSKNIGEVRLMLL